MKKVNLFFCTLLFAFELIVFALKVTLYFFDMIFSLNYTLCAWIFLVLSISSLMTCKAIIDKRKNIPIISNGETCEKTEPMKKSTSGKIYISFIFPLSFGNFIIMFLGKGISFELFLSLVSLILCGFISWICGNRKASIITGFVPVSVVALLVVTPLGFFVLFVSIHGDLFPEVIVYSEQSPYNSCVAQVVYVDEGMLGGHTTVEVTDPLPITNVIIGEIKNKPQEIYYLNGYESYKNVEVYWESETTLIVNGKRYTLE